MRHNLLQVVALGRYLNLDFQLAQEITKILFNESKDLSVKESILY